MTPFQKKTLIAINQHIIDNGLSPSMREICELVGRSSVGGMFSTITSLVKMGYLRRTNAGRRNLEVTEAGHDKIGLTSCMACGQKTGVLFKGHGPMLSIPEIEHGLYHALTPYIETLTNCDPCSSIRLSAKISKEIANNLIKIINDEKTSGVPMLNDELAEFSFYDDPMRR